MSKPKLTILFAPLDMFGHINTCIGIAEPLLARGHRVVFGITEAWRGKLAKYGFEEVFYTKEELNSIDKDNPHKVRVNIFESLADSWRGNSLDGYKRFADIFLGDVITTNMESDG